MPLAFCAARHNAPAAGVRRVIVLILRVIYLVATACYRAAFKIYKLIYHDPVVNEANPSRAEPAQKFQI